jgi:hypothetical protein
MRRFLQLVVLAFALLTATLALADWKQDVKAAGGFWAGNPSSEGWHAMLVPNGQEQMKRLPSGVRTLVEADVEDNEWIKGHAEMADKLGKFTPEAGQVFRLPYIAMPASSMKFAYEAEHMSANMAKTLRYRAADGTEMVRFFFHPLYADRYSSLIEKYGVHYGEYVAKASASPRSLVVWEDGKPERPVWMKVNVHATIDAYSTKQGDVVKKTGVSRVQTEKKARRAALVDNLLSTMTDQERATHQVDFMPEPASYVPGDIVDGKGNRVGFDRALIARDLPESLLKGKTSYLPGFAFIGRLEEFRARHNKLHGTNLGPMEFAEKHLAEPLIRTFLYLGLEHGVQGELHTQNFMMEIGENGLPTGKVLVKDLDGFRVDVDMRVRNGKSIQFLRGYDHPFEWAKHGATQGRSGQPAVLHAWFNRLIRNVNGFNTERDGKIIRSTPAGQIFELLSEQHANLKVSSDDVQAMFDGVAQRTFHQMTGVEIPMDSWKYARGKGIDGGLGMLRGKLRDVSKTPDPPEAQGILHAAWTRLKSDQRVYKASNAQSLKYVYLGEGVIEARVASNGAHAGYALLEPSGTEAFEGSLRGVGVAIPQYKRAPYLPTVRYQTRGAQSAPPRVNAPPKAPAVRLAANHS